MQLFDILKQMRKNIINDIRNIYKMDKKQVLK